MPMGCELTQIKGDGIPGFPVGLKKGLIRIATRYIKPNKMSGALGLSVITSTAYNSAQVYFAGQKHSTMSPFPGTHLHFVHDHQ